MTHGVDNAIAIMGATATGKSELAIRLAEKYDGEVISMDSRQAYRGLDIGTGKISAEDQARVPHHLIDVLDPHEPNTAGKHMERALGAWAEIRGRGRVAIFAGGTGLYFRALFRGLIDVQISDDDLVAQRNELSTAPTWMLYEELERVDPERAAELSPRDRVRIQRSIEIYRCTGSSFTDHVARQNHQRRFAGLKLVLSMPREKLRDRIAERTRELYARGWCREVRELLAGGVAPDAPAMNSLGYDLIAQTIRRGEDPLQTIDAVITVTQQYAKRQETFFRSVRDAVWIDVSRPGWDREIDRRVRIELGL
ncbi:MAG: tRNA (adenosine(37)-N6)-dimethylallyltransferase MiaA [bacterium]